MAVILVRLTPAQRSAVLIEEPGEGSYGDADLDEGMRLLADAVRPKGLVFDERDREKIAAAVNHLSNSNEEQAEAGHEARFTRQAAKSLATLYGKILRSF